MDILGIGPLELLFILIIALIVLGPKDMAKAGRTIGRYLRTIVTSPTWHAVQNTSRGTAEFTKQINQGSRCGGEDLKDIGSIIPNTKDFIPSLSLDDDGGTIETNDAPSTEGNSSDDISDWITPPAAKEAQEPPQSSTEPND